MAITHPVGNLRQLRYSLSKLRLNKLSIGADGHNRCLLSPFRSKTGRNQPSNNKFIFGPSTWLRGLIKPAPGLAVAYLDFEAQEYGTGAGLSRDPKMLAAYLTGDPYLTFAKQALAVPDEATKKSHEKVRNQYKQGSLSTMYGIEAAALALRLGIHPLEARSLLESHRGLYTKFWAWSDNALNHCLLHGWQETVFGWRRHLGRDDINVRSLRNFWIQGNAAEMLRLAAILGTEAGIRICAPVHDAFLIMAPLEEIQSDIEKMCNCMRTASRVVLKGFELRIEVASVVRYPGRYQDKRGVEMWDEVMRLLDTL
jgi:DNA polymerase I